jgi:hypothetical protein
VGTPVKNPDRVPSFSQVDNPLGTARGGDGGVIVATGSSVVDAKETTMVSPRSVSAQNDVIPEDGIYQDGEGNRFQFRKDTVVPPGSLKLLKKTDPFPDPQTPGVAEFGQTIASPDEAATAAADAQKAADDKAAADAAAAAKAQADADAKAAADAKAKADADAKAATDAKAAPAVENKAAPAPADKKA